MATKTIINDKNFLIYSVYRNFSWKCKGVFARHYSIISISCDIHICMHLYGIMKFVDEEKETEDVQIGSLGSDLPSHIDRKMWAEDKDNLEV